MAAQSPVTHNVYVLAPARAPRGAGGPLAQGADAWTPGEKKSRKLTLAVLEYVHGRLALFSEMGVRVRVHRVRGSDLEDPRLVAAMKDRGITSLPALLTPNGAYCGNNRIRDVYDKNVQEFRAWKRVQGPAAGLAPEDDLAAFYRSEMTFERAAADDGLGDGDEIGEGGGMMDAFRHTMRRREPPAARRDNVGAGDNDDTMDALIDRMAGGIGAQAFAGGEAPGALGGDSLDLDAGGDVQDDLMERAYWANQELTM
jgi:hypothetical protein